MNPFSRKTILFLKPQLDKEEYANEDKESKKYPDTSFVVLPMQPQVLSVAYNNKYYECYEEHSGKNPLTRTEHAFLFIFGQI